MAYNPKVQAPICFDTVASRTVLPLQEFRAKLGMEGQDPDAIGTATFSEVMDNFPNDFRDRQRLKFIQISRGGNMKRALIICGLFCELMIGLSAVSAQKVANFAGTWELDKAKSQLPQRQADSIKSSTWTVTQDDKQLTNDQKFEGVEDAGGGGRGMGAATLTVKLDGSETTTETQGGKLTTKAKWTNDGKTLEITSVRSGESQGNAITFTTTEHWELSEDGKTLKVNRKTETPRGPRESTWALTKK